MDCRNNVARFIKRILRVEHLQIWVSFFSLTVNVKIIKVDNNKFLPKLSHNLLKIY